MSKERLDPRALVAYHVAHLFNTWTWERLIKDRQVSHLIFTGYGAYRRDNRISQRVGKTYGYDYVKFKFKHRAEQMFTKGDWQDEPHRFCISYGDPTQRLIWVTSATYNQFWIKRDKSVVTRVNVGELFLDCLNPTKEEIDMVEMLYPEIIALLPKFEQGFANVRKKLMSRFHTSVPSDYAPWA